MIGGYAGTVKAQAGLERRLALLTGGAAWARSWAAGLPEACSGGADTPSAILLGLLLVYLGLHLFSSGHQSS